MKPEPVIIYEKPTCSTCRISLKMLLGAHVPFKEVDYYKKPFTKTKLKSLLAKMDMRPADLLRKNEPIYKELGLGQGTHTDSEILDLLIKYPDLIQRPIVEKGDAAILGRPPEKILGFVKD
jgi:arsenate reductase